MSDKLYFLGITASSGQCISSFSRRKKNPNGPFFLNVVRGNSALAEEM